MGVPTLEDTPTLYFVVNRACEPLFRSWYQNSPGFGWVMRFFHFFVSLFSYFVLFVEQRKNQQNFCSLFWNSQIVFVGVSASVRRLFGVPSVFFYLLIGESCFFVFLGRVRKTCVWHAVCSSREQFALVVRFLS